jgi:hypothetical protein
MPKPKNVDDLLVTGQEIKSNDNESDDTSSPPAKAEKQKNTKSKSTVKKETPRHDTTTDIKKDSSSLDHRDNENNRVSDSDTYHTASDDSDSDTNEYDQAKDEEIDEDNRSDEDKRSEEDRRKYGTDQEMEDGDGKRNEKSSDIESEDETDEYGTKIAKPRTYTEEEVQRMIRDRLSRGSHANHQASQPTQQQINKAAGDFVFDENSDQDFQTQLKMFVKNTFKEIHEEDASLKRREREQKEYTEFQDKFTAGMSKYPDFVDVVGDKPITDAMVMATRAMEKPAAFLYAAAKTNAKELERISRIADPFQQATEIGRLEERMRKSKIITRSSRPIESDKGDVVDKKPVFVRDIDRLIDKHAKSKPR